MLVLMIAWLAWHFGLPDLMVQGSTQLIVLLHPASTFTNSLAPPFFVKSFNGNHGNGITMHVVALRR